MPPPQAQLVGLLLASALALLGAITGGVQCAAAGAVSAPGSPSQIVAEAPNGGGGAPVQQPQNSAALLNQLQSQAQRQFQQLNGLVASAANNFNANSTRLNNVLETLSSVAKGIQQQINAGGVHIVTGGPGGPAAPGGEPANSRKNEYNTASFVEAQPSAVVLANASSPSNNYREQGEQLRHEIVRRAGQLQQVVASSMELMKNNGDLIVRRLLEQMNSRLDQAKAKADRIVSEPATSEVALRALSAINLGLNNLNTIISNIVARLDLAAKESGAQRASAGQPAVAAPLDAAKLRSGLHQLGQQFQAAFNGSQLHQQLLGRQRQLLALGPTGGEQPVQNKDFQNQRRI